MSWVKLDDSFPDHPKLLAAGALAGWLWACGLAYCNRQKRRTGIIPAEKVKVLFPLPNPAKLAARLVEVGLWERVEGGFHIHDYHDFQPTEDVSAARAEAGKLGGMRSGEARRSKQSASSQEAHAKQIASGAEPLASNPVPVPGSVPEEIHVSSAASSPVRSAGIGFDPVLLDKAAKAFPALFARDAWYAVVSLVWKDAKGGSPPVAKLQPLDELRADGVRLERVVRGLRRYLADPDRMHGIADFVAHLNQWAAPERKPTQSAAAAIPDEKPERTPEEIASVRATVATLSFMKKRELA